MNTKLLLLSIAVAAVSSCTTTYKTGQTPDDVYYSPARYYDVSKNNNDNDKNVNHYYSDERQIRMGINDWRWRTFDNDIYYNPYAYGYNYGYYYNPYYYPYPIYNPIIVVTQNPKVITPRTINLGGYGTGYNNTNTGSTTKMGGYVAPVRNYNNSNKYNSRKSDYNNTSESNRSYTPTYNNSSNNSSNSSSSGNSSSSETSRPARKGKGG